VPFFVQVIPAGDDGVLAVLAGQTEAVERAGRERGEEQWKSTIGGRADLIVAALSGSDREQTWLNVARALAAALRVVEEGGAIVVCSDLREAAGPAVRWLAATETPETALREIVHERPADALAAAELLEAVSRARVYLLSGLPPTIVEDIGLSPIEGSEQLQRLIAQHSSCIVLANAQYVVPTPAGEQEDESQVVPDRQRTKRR
jgi:nickel-dependent lactate racemase